jgi:hypothetical protein
MQHYKLYSFFKNWDTKTCLWTGMAMFALMTLGLVKFHAEKEYVMASFALTGQMAAALWTYVNSNKPNQSVPDSFPPPEIKP